MTKGKHLLAVGHLYTIEPASGAETIRVIAARKATTKERHAYENADRKKEGREDFALKAEHDFSGGVPGRFYRPKKLSTSLRIADDIRAYFKRLASEKKVGYQTLINSALRDYCQGH